MTARSVRAFLQLESQVVDLMHEHQVTTITTGEEALGGGRVAGGQPRGSGYFCFSTFSADPALNHSI